jgi:hypothetical protein
MKSEHACREVQNSGLADQGCLMFAAGSAALLPAEDACTANVSAGQIQ